MFSFNSWHNKEFRFVYQPDYSLGYRSRRFLVSANKQYITDSNAKLAFSKASNMRGDKLRLRFRKYGILDIYVK